MKVNNFRRFNAFLIDLLIVLLFLMIIYYFVPENNLVNKINENIAQLNEQIMKHDIGYKDYIMNVSDNIYKLDYERIPYTAFNILIIILYFIVIPTITKGYTIGMYLLNLKLKGKITINNLFLRNLITTGLLYLLTSFVAIYLFKGTTYFLVLTILGFIQILLVIISTFMVLYKQDGKGIQDIISGTGIIKSKEVKEWDNLQNKN